MCQSRLPLENPWTVQPEGTKTITKRSARASPTASRVVGSFPEPTQALPGSSASLHRSTRCFWRGPTRASQWWWNVRRAQAGSWRHPRVLQLDREQPGRHRYLPSRWDRHGLTDGRSSPRKAQRRRPAGASSACPLHSCWLCGEAPHGRRTRVGSTLAR